MRPRLIDGLDRLALGAALLCPVFLTHGRGLAEAAIDATAIAFLLRSVLGGGWSWTRALWVRIAGLWWAWLVLCSVPVSAFVGVLGQGGWGSFAQAVMTLRFLVFAAALPVLLDTPCRRRAMAWLIGIACAYIAAQCWLQFVTGHNLFGTPRYGDGSLTGPYDKPRTGPILSRLLYPAMLPVSVWLLQRAQRHRGGLRQALRGGAAAVILGGIVTMVLVGQRMPLLLTGLGLIVTGLMIARLRPVVLAGCVLVPLAVAASAVISPPSFHHLVIVFSHQMEHFPSSQYGQIAARAVAIARANPWTGRGFDGFRTGCPDPRYFHGWFGGDGGGAAMCVQHPHNHYLQAVTDSGLPGLTLFCLMVLAWLATCGRGLWRDRGQDAAGASVWRAWRVGLFVAVFIQEWPIASASAFTNMPLGGWFFLLLGVGLAEARAYMSRQHATRRG